MQQLISLVLWSHVVWLSASNMTDSEWSSILPGMESLCPPVDVCGRTDTTNMSTMDNPCCRGCSCEENCHEEGNCCFGDEQFGTQPSNTDCLKPSTMSTSTDLPTYTYITGPPTHGCKSQDEQATCSSNITVAPWGNFYPVYSKSLDANFKNEPCALCHGAESDDLRHWSSAVVYTGGFNMLPAMVGFLETYNSSVVSVGFYPPSKDSMSYDKRCFDVIGTCPLEGKDTFDVPSYVGLDRPAIIKACEQGPQAMYIRNHVQAYRNVFCAMCNYWVSIFQDKLWCTYSGNVRTTNSPFISLFNTNYLKSLKTSPRDTKSVGPCFRPGYAVNDSTRCVQPLCPTMQTRFPDGKCDYAASEVIADCIQLYLNLSTATFPNKSAFFEMDQSERLSIFTAANPWPKIWKIEEIDEVVAINQSERSSRTDIRVILSMAPNKRLNFRLVTQSIGKLLSNPWVLDMGGGVEFSQDLLKVSYSMMGYSKVPIYITAHFIPAYCLYYTKLFYCQQIELLSSEYRIESHRLHIPHAEKILFFNEFLVVEAEDGSKSVRVCVEDSGYVWVDSQRNNARTPCLGMSKLPFLLILILYMCSL